MKFLLILVILPPIAWLGFGIVLLTRKIKDLREKKNERQTAHKSVLTVKVK